MKNPVDADRIRAAFKATQGIAEHSLDDGDHVQQHVDLQINPQEFVFQSSYDLQKLYLKLHNIPRTMMAYNHHHDLDLDFYAALRLGCTPFGRSGAY